MKAAKQKSPDVVLLEPGRVVDVPVSMLMPDPSQPRTEFDEDDLRAFGEELKKNTVEVPLLVRSDYVIKDGERRWRAAKLAGLETVPCILAKPAADEQPDLERLLDQAAVNDHREPLSVLDWSRLLRRLVEDHKLPVKDLPELLAARGFKRLSRSYISNIMRLDDLPDWAQALLRDGALTPSDGKYLLMAKPWPKAMQWLRDHIKSEAKDVKEGESLRDVLFRYEHDDMEQLVSNAYDETAIELSKTWGDGAPLFKWATSCKGCDKRQAIANDHFCLDETCFNEKQAKAKAAATSSTKDKPASGTSKPKPKKPTGPTEAHPDQDGVVILGKMKSDKYNALDAGYVRFEPAMHCTGCEHNRLAAHRKTDKPEPTCFNPPCFDQKQRNGNRGEGVAQWLDKRLLPLVEAKLTNNYDLQFQLLAWMALGAPTQTSREFTVGSRLRDESRRAQRRANLRNPGAVIQAYVTRSLNGETIALAGVRALLSDRAHFYAFARHLGIQLTPAIAHLDAEYLDLKRKGELVDLLHAVGITEVNPEATPILKLKLEELVEVCLSAAAVELIGVPHDVQALYDHLEPVFELDDDDDLDDEDDVSGETGYDQGGEDTPVGADHADE